MGVFDFNHVYTAYKQCRRRKRHTSNAQRYEVYLLDNLWATVQRLKEHTWKPARSIFFIALKPKAREIHAADFADRVVHHVLVPPLEALFEPIFIHDCYSNRKNKGTHKAVKRLQSFMKSNLDRYGKAYYLQLDVRNFFNSIHRPLLFKFINHRLGKSVRQGKIQVDQAKEISWCCHILLKHDLAENLLKKGPEWTFDRVPEYKRLTQVGKNYGLPIGNLTSQFFANVYLNELDQYVKHTLKCQCYVRYVDDMVVVHHDVAQLGYWQQKIEGFLHDRLKLELKQDTCIEPASAGADFLGYIVRPGYMLVRRRVVGNLLQKLRQFEQAMVHAPNNNADSCVIHLEHDQRERLRATLASYLGHFKHANSIRLIQSISQRFSWLPQLFHLYLHGKILHQGYVLMPRWQPIQVSSLRSQWRYFKSQHPNALVIMQVGRVYEVYDQDALLMQQYFQRPLVPQKAIGRYGVKHCLRYHVAAVKELCQHLRKAEIPYQLIIEEGYLRGGMKRRVLRQLYYCGFLQANTNQWPSNNLQLHSS